MKHPCIIADHMQETHVPRVAGVYFLHAPDCERVKIGWANNVHRRMNELRTGCPVPVILRFILDLPRSMEHELHLEFSGLRRHGEWFDESVLSLSERYPRVHGYVDLDLSRDDWMSAAWSQTL